LRHLCWTHGSGLRPRQPSAPAIDWDAGPRPCRRRTYFSNPRAGCRAPVGGLVAAAFVSIGGVVATIAGNGFSETLGEPSELVACLGALVQIAGLVIALPAGVVAVRSFGSRRG
jgi:hypothetical protein